MKLTTPALTLMLSFAVCTPLFAQEDDSLKIQSSKSPMTLFSRAPIGKVYIGNSLDGVIFSTALIDNSGTNSLGTLRFTMFFHFGSTLNYNFCKSVGIYTGLDIKNIGFIEKFDANNVTVKERVYTVGIPVGLRLGNMRTRDYFFLGGGLDAPIHYKSKYWSNTVKKTKFNEWFSERTPHLLPYVFAGASFSGTTLKVQYYPGNFVNEDFRIGTSMPYAGKKVNLLLFSVGRDMKFGRKK